jgi:hypothetical protein
MATGVRSAAVAVFERTDERAAEVTPKPASSPRGELANTRSERSRRATRTSRPYFRKASPRRKLPMKR